MKLRLNCLFNTTTLILAILVSASSAMAANSWDGPFVGLYGGMAWTDTSFSTNTGAVTGLSYFVSNQNIASVNNSGSGHAHSDIGTVSIALGDIWHYKRLFYGLVADFGLLNFTDTKEAANIVYPTSSPATYNEKVSANTNWLFTARFNLGLAPAHSAILPFLTGGLALSNLQVANSFSDNANSLGSGGTQRNKTTTGWTAGLGMAVPFHKHWLFDAEYLFVDFGQVTASSSVICTAAGICAAGVTSPLNTTANLQVSIVRFLLGYRF